MIIKNSRIAFEFLRAKLNDNQEEVYVLCLDSHLKLLHHELVFRGTVDYSVFHPRDVFRIGLRHNSHSLMIAHNHPSGNSLPSKQDRKITKNLMKLGQILEIPVIDHIIFCRNEYYSFAEKKKTSALHRHKQVHLESQTPHLFQP